MEPLLELREVKKHFPIFSGDLLRTKHRLLKALDGVNLSLERGACFGIAGESGSGKTTLARLILLLERASSGEILLEGKNAARLTDKETAWYRTRVQAVFQDAASSLNPRMRVKDIVSEPLEIQREKLDRQLIESKTEQLIRRVGLSATALRMYPHELSGGQKQRVAIARAIILHPALVVLDEPVSALDVSIRAQILNLLADIQAAEGISYLIIAHDLAVLQNVTTQIAVMYLGRVVETGNTDGVFDDPRHPYTKALLAAVPRPEPGRVKSAPALSGEIGNPLDLPRGCRFHPRCPQAQDKCKQVEPVVQDIKPGHRAACHLL